jgi:hypothetical protein
VPIAAHAAPLAPEDKVTRGCVARSAVVPNESVIPENTTFVYGPIDLLKSLVIVLS